MYGILSKLLITGKLKFTNGKIIGFDLPFGLIPMSSIKSMTDDVMKKGIKDISDLYFHGWVYGYTVTKNLVKLLNLKKFEERYKVAMDIVGVVGFGDYRTLSFKQADHAKFKVLGNPFALQYYPSNKFVCHYLRGMEAGGGCWVHEILINNIEFECAAITGSNCLHMNLSPARIAEVDKKLLKSQLDIDYVIKREKEFIKDCGDDPSFFGL